MSKAPRLVYFDRSAWADLVRDQDAGGDATDRLRRAVTANRVKIAISDAVVDETLPLLAQSIAVGSRHLSLLLNLADWKKGVVKLPKDLVRDEALAVLNGEGRPSSFRSSYKTKSVVKRLPEIARREPKRIAAEAARIRMRKITFESGIKRLRQQMLLNKRHVVGRAPTLSAAIKTNAPTAIEGLLKSLRVRPMSPQELRDVLAAPAPRTYAAVHVAYVYFQVVREWAPKHGDGYDLLHAVAATSASEFVSGDGRLRELVKSAGRGDPVVWSLRNFIDSLSP